MKALKIPVFVVLTFLFSGCPIFNNDYDFKYHTIVSNTPVNLVELNTEYDDFNSDLPYEYFGPTLFFSSNRNSSGKNFDIIYRDLGVSYHKKDDVVNFDWDENYDELFEKEISKHINNNFNQLGPLFLEGRKGMNYFFYASDDSGQFDIQLVYSPRSEWAFNGQKRLFGPVNLKGINSSSDDYYPTIDPGFTKMWFCSNRENNQFDIYSVSLNPDEYLHEYLNKTNLVIVNEAVLSGLAEDKCPVLFGDYLIFTSNRPGGFGGFDLYYSKLENNQWTSPMNFGAEINSASDEYRPFPFEIGGKTVVIFSSNRPGGNGGFDLYAVRIDELN